MGEVESDGRSWCGEHPSIAPTNSNPAALMDARIA
jgi:hypothetical protein